MPTLSVIIITKNEAHDIEHCLQSVAWADEIIVLDSGSTDNTVALCRPYTPHVFRTDWPGYGAQKNRALARATSDWVLSLDADNQLTEALQHAIQTLPRTEPPAQAYTIPVHSFYYQKCIRYGDWRNERRILLFQKDQGQFTDTAVHEYVHVRGTVGALKAPLLHRPFQSPHEMIQKLNDYSTLSAQMHAERGTKSTLWKAITHSLWRFVHGYVLRLGFLDGREGLLLAISNAQGTYYRYIKLLHLQGTAL